jgi:hypothetical protein
MVLSCKIRGVGIEAIAGRYKRTVAAQRPLDLAGRVRWSPLRLKRMSAAACLNKTKGCLTCPPQTYARPQPL